MKKFFFLFIVLGFGLSAIGQSQAKYFPTKENNELRDSLEQFVTSFREQLPNPFSFTYKGEKMEIYWSEIHRQSGVCYVYFTISPPSGCVGSTFTARVVFVTGAAPWTVVWYYNGVFFATTPEITFTPDGPFHLDCTATDATLCQETNSQPITSEVHSLPTVSILTLGNVYIPSTESGNTITFSETTDSVYFTVTSPYGCQATASKEKYQCPKDTVEVPIFVPYPVHDTTVVEVPVYIPYPVHDTTVIEVPVYVPYPVHDTTVIETIKYVFYPVHDTIWLNGGCPDYSGITATNHDGKVCQNDYLSLVAPLSNSYLWNNGDEERVIPIGTAIPGTYLFSCIVNGNKTLFFTVYVYEPLPPPTIATPGGQTIFCNNTTLSSDQVDPNFKYQWYRNGIALLGETHPTVFITESGDYVVRVTTPCDEQFSNSLWITIADCGFTGGVDGEVENNFSVYPNPSDGTFFVDMPEEGDVQFVMYDINGQIVLKGIAIGDFRVQLNLPVGLYVLHVVTAKNELYIKKIEMIH